MAVATFDTLKFTNKLKEVGVPPAQAEAEAALFSEILQINLRDLATKDDLRHLEERLNARLESLEQRFSALLIEVCQDLQAQIDGFRQEMLLLEQRLTGRIDQSRQELNARIDQSKQEVNARIDSLAQEQKFLRWMVAAVITGIVTMLIRMFFFRGS